MKLGSRRRDLREFAAQLVGESPLVQDFLELAAESAVNEQVGFEIAQRITHGE